MSDLKLIRIDSHDAGVRAGRFEQRHRDADLARAARLTVMGRRNAEARTAATFYGRRQIARVTRG